MSLYTLDDLDLATLRGRRVFVRVDFNVPLRNGEVLDTTRLEESLPTLRELHGAGAKVVLASHCGRPAGIPDERYSLRPVAAALAGLVGQDVAFAEDCVGGEAVRAVGRLQEGGLLLLENLRFHVGEKANDRGFADALSVMADVFVGDAFGSAHRAHASVVGVAERLAAKAAGRLMVKEVDSLSRLLGEPERPFVGILGGAKIEGKIDTLENLLPRLDVLLLGGGMANTFLAARGHELKQSLVEPDRVDLAAEILRRAEAQGTRVLLPTDLVVTDSLSEPQLVETVSVDAVVDGRMAVDVGVTTRSSFVAACRGAGTLFWNGPLGVFETPPFHEGTQSVAEGLAQCGGFTVIGGGETVAAVRRAGVAESLSHVSTGGGASLELLAGKTLPGIAVLERPDQGDG
ncbi:MAG: phosphoglycerate kinase [Thermoanaerobaculia bacterium]|nr:phosphoglycerate kinase [Thermoanaerobaculia bacterium]